MDRFTISLDDNLAHEFDHLIAERGYSNRSEAVRDILRGHLAKLRETVDHNGPCVANLSYVYNHHERNLSDRLANHQHEQHDLTIASTHAHLDHDNCIETVLLKGPAHAVRKFADKLMAESGVHHGQLNLVMASAADPGAAAVAGSRKTVKGQKHTH